MRISSGYTLIVDLIIIIYDEDDRLRVLHKRKQQKTISYLGNVHLQLDTMLLFIRFQLQLLLHREFWCFADAPFPRCVLFTDFIQTREPFFSWIDQLKATLFHHQITATIIQFGCGGTQKLVA